MDYGTIFFIIFAVIIIVIYQNKRINNNRAKVLLTELESEFSKKFIISGEVYFTKLHILLDVDLKILYTENELLISGYDYYRDRRTTFVFYNNKNLNLLSKLSIPKYLITEVEIIENESIIIKSGEKIKITLNYKKYGKEKPQLKEVEFDNLIKTLNKKTTYNTV